MAMGESMHLRGGIDAAARAAAVIAGLVSAVTSIFVGDEVGQSLAVVLTLAFIAVLATPAIPGPIGPGIGVVCGVVVVLALGDELFDPKPTPRPSHALIGLGVPTIGHYFAWVAAWLLVLAAAVALVVSLRKAQSRFSIKASFVAGAVAGAIVLGLGVVPSVALADATQDRLANPDHTTATGARPPVADTGAPTWQHQRWQLPAVAVGPREGERDVAAVPGRGLVVVTDTYNGSPDMLRVLDAGTGTERWHDQITAVSTFVDARDGRLLVVDREVAVVFDLETGRILGTAHLPEAQGWQRLSAMPDMSMRLPVTGRTVVVGASGERPEKVLAIDVVSLRTTVLEDNPGDCQYAMPEGSTDVVQLIRFECAKPARLEVTGDGVAATFALPVSAGDSLAEAVATANGAVLGFGTPGSSAVNLLLGVVTGKQEPVLRETPDNGDQLTAVVLPATAVDPQRILLARAAHYARYGQPGPTTELVDTAGARLTAPTAIPRIEPSFLNPVLGVGDRIYVPGRTNAEGMSVLDAHTFRVMGTVPNPCEVRTRGGAGSVGVVLCENGRLLAYD